MNMVSTGSYTVDYLKETTAGNRGDFEDRVGNATVDQLNIPEVNLELRSLPIVAKTQLKVESCLVT